MEICHCCTSFFPQKFQASFGQAQCDSCASGRFGNTTGLSGCLNCPAGAYSPLPQQTACTLCGVGKSNGVPEQAACVDCAAGSYTNTNGSTQCTPCSPGASDTPHHHHHLLTRPAWTLQLADCQTCSCVCLFHSPPSLRTASPSARRVTTARPTRFQARPYARRAPAVRLRTRRAC